MSRDSRGTLDVRTLRYAALSAGSSTVEWDGTDAGGRPVIRGIYLAGPRAAEIVGVEQMVLVR